MQLQKMQGGAVPKRLTDKEDMIHVETKVSRKGRHKKNKSQSKSRSRSPRKSKSRENQRASASKGILKAVTPTNGKTSGL